MTNSELTTMIDAIIDPLVKRYIDYLETTPITLLNDEDKECLEWSVMLNVAITKISRSEAACKGLLQSTGRVMPALRAVALKHFGDEA